MSLHAHAWREHLIAYLRANAHPVYKFAHQPRLYALACRIARENTPPVFFDDDVVFAAAYLHDLGVFIGHRPADSATLAQWDHIGYVCALAPELLTRFRFPSVKIEAVLEAIREHQPRDEPHSPEATLLRDADILEQLGAIGILRTAAKLDSDTRFHLLADVQSSLQRSLQRLPGQLRLEAARRLAAPRIELLRHFLEDLMVEADTDLG